MNLNLKVSKAQQKNNIVVFFLSSDEKKGDSYLSLSEGLEKKLVTVNEVDKKEFFLNVFNASFISSKFPIGVDRI